MASSDVFVLLVGRPETMRF